jgi:hypothetical protein
MTLTLRAAEALLPATKLKVFLNIFFFDAGDVHSEGTSFLKKSRRKVKSNMHRRIVRTGRREKAISSKVS